MRTLRITLTIVAITALLAGQLLRKERVLDERAALEELAPDAFFSGKTGSPPHYLSGDLAAFNSFDVTTTVRGYAGPIKVMIALGRDGTIRRITIIEHRETKNYVHYMENRKYLDRYTGKSVHDRFEIDRDIDGITRATVSVEALARTVRDSSRTVAANVFGIAVRKDEGSGAESYGWAWYVLLFAAAVAGYFLSRRSRDYLRLRDATLIAGIVVIGIYLSSPFSILHILNLALFRPSFSLLWLMIVISTLLSVAVAGRFYCGWLCPFGALSEFIGRLPESKWSIPRELDDRWRMVKYYLLGAVIMTVFLTKRVDYGNYETYVTLFSLHGNVLTWSLVVLSLLANLRVERFWCRFLCPVAALTGVLTRKAEGYPSRPDCPMANRTNPLISECIRCNRCYLPEEKRDRER
ncbi:MAG TPA: 4Fe-4S binding protein [Nitrospirota bacterium]|nr:4Fe-4S binding protein [Nitrospirota bacterium]